jgi:formate dehydrogenase major subunit
MLQYAIPEYRLPRNILDAEIESLRLDIEAKRELGRDFDLESLNSQFDAVFIGIGAQKPMSMRVEGEELALSGLDFLKAVAKGKRPHIGKKTAVVGGGNTAIDCARTALRFGADVTILYRRTRAEMPAEETEIEDAEAEGVKFQFLCAPVRIRDAGVECMKMRLGDPDVSGRRRPIPIDGSEFFFSADTIISAIGQKSEMELSERDGKVFSAGDCVTGPKTVVEAIAGGRRAAFSIDAYLNHTKKKAVYIHLKEGVERDDLPDTEEIERVSVKKEHRLDFSEIEEPLSEEEAEREAERCIECGCKKVDDCRLRDYAGEYNVNPERVKGEVRRLKPDLSKDGIIYDPGKCILCGKCITVCKEKGLSILGFANRGFSTEIKPKFGLSLKDAGCNLCLECVRLCPTGGFCER